MTQINAKNCGPIKIGLPSNGRMAQDCGPFLNELGLREGLYGQLTSEFVPDAIFLRRRVGDIAWGLKRKAYQLGIIGDDTALEAGIGYLTYPRQNPPFTLTGEDRMLSFKVQKTSNLSFLVRREADITLEGLKRGGGKIITSYPNASEWLIREATSSDLKPDIRTDRRMETLFINAKPPDRYCGPKVPLIEIVEVEGQVESIVRNQDIPNIGGVDVVGSGETRDRYGLVTLLTLLESRPGLWTPSYLRTENKTQIIDAIEQMRERLREFLYE